MEASERVRAILCFVQAADRGSFAAAARALGISGPAVSKNVAGLEGALGVRLFNRSTRALRLTAEGQAFLHQARIGLGALEEACDAVAAQRASPAGVVRLSTSVAFGRQYLLPLLPSFEARFPAIRLELDFDDRISDLVREGYDLVIRGGLIPDSALISRRLFPIRLLTVAAPAYLARHGIPRLPDDLAAHRLIGVRFLGTSLQPWQFATPKGEVSILPASGPVFSAPELATEAALLGMGITRTGLFHILPALEEGRLKILLHGQALEEERHMYLQYPHRAQLAPRVRVLVDYLLEAFTALTGLHADDAALQRFAA